MALEEAIPSVNRRENRVAAAVRGRPAAEQRGPMGQFGLIRRFEWNRLRLPIRSLPPGLDQLRLLHLSDLHFNHAWHPAYDRLIERVQNDPPDLILFTGDFVESKVDYRPAWPKVQRLISSLRARLGMFSITGNHDGDFLALQLGSLGVRVCTTEALRLDFEGSAIELIGLAGEDRHDLRDSFVQAIPPKQPAVPRIVMTHFPDLLRRIGTLRADLVLAGHTHGGQVCLPGGIPIIRHDTLPPRYARGVHRVGENDETWLMVSRGMGFSNYPIRLFCPAEVVEITLTPAGPATTRGFS
jgi:hypothetical protein